MILALRVDHRLLHGQVALSWAQAIGTDCILLVSDTLVRDKLKLQAIKMAKPEGVKIVAKTIDDSIAAIRSGITDKYKLFIVAETIEGGGRLAKELGIKRLNLGGTAPGEGKEQLGRAVYVSKSERQYLKGLVNSGVYCFIQGVPSNNEMNIEKIL